eukprot:5596671-Ditylum_brightwellii.AAC.1
MHQGLIGVTLCFKTGGGSCGGCGLLAGYWVCFLVMFSGGRLSEQGYSWCAQWSEVFVAGGRRTGSSIVGDVSGSVV